jgi:hypothetical protein
MWRAGSSTLTRRRRFCSCHRRRCRQFVAGQFLVRQPELVATIAIPLSEVEPYSLTKSMTQAGVDLPYLTAACQGLSPDHFRAADSRTANSNAVLPCKPCIKLAVSMQAACE